MGNTHPLNHVPLYWLSGAPGLKPGSVRLRPLKFSSALLVSLPGSSLRNFDTRSKFSSARHKPLRSVGFRGTIHSPKLQAKVSAAKSKLSDISHVQSRDVQYMSHVVMQLLKRGRSFQALRKILEKLKDASELIGWEPEMFFLFSDNFPIRLLRSFNWPFSDGRESKFKSFTSRTRRRCNRLNSRSCFLSFRSIAVSFY